MPTAPCTDLLGPLMARLLECADDALTSCGDPTGLVHLAPGAEVAYDNCCEGEGQLWVRAVNVFPTGGPRVPFPQVDAQQQCGVSALGVRLGVGVIRCAHTLDDGAEPPTAEEMTSDALQTTSDMQILLGAIRCCFTEQVNGPAPKIEQWLPTGPRGGCVGGEWTLIVPLDVCGCLPDGEG